MLYFYPQSVSGIFVDCIDKYDMEYRQNCKIHPITHFRFIDDKIIRKFSRIPCQMINQILHGRIWRAISGFTILKL
jgi:hypothetical protein